MSRRIIPLVLIAVLLGSLAPRPALAVSTAAEIARAKHDDQELRRQYEMVDDPLLTAWVNGVARKLWLQVARKDVPYSVHVIDDPTINSFTIGGGYIYVNTGLLDFVQSDDELAGVIGHETGHNERRHTVTFQAKEAVASLLFGLAGVLSPALFSFGQVVEAGTLAKIQRVQELQADQYGVLLMSRAGYDPDAMLSMMRHLGTLHDDHEESVDRYFADHPGEPDRVAHLLGYPELDPTKRQATQTLVQALHDAHVDRYNIANIKLRAILTRDPTSALAQLEFARTQMALGQTQKSAQTFALAASDGDAATKSAALAELRRLRDAPARFSPFDPRRPALRASLAAAQAAQARQNDETSMRAKDLADRLSGVNQRVQDVAYGLPTFSHARSGSRTATLVEELTTMSRSVDEATGRIGEVAGGVGRLQNGEPSGMLEENAAILGELRGALAVDPIPPPSLALLSSYPQVIADVGRTNDDLRRALDASFAAIVQLQIGLGDFDILIKQIAYLHGSLGGEIDAREFAALQPAIHRADASLHRAATLGAQARQAYDLARARQLQSRITLLGVSYPPGAIRRVRRRAEDALRRRSHRSDDDGARRPHARRGRGRVDRRRRYERDAASDRRPSASVAYDDRRRRRRARHERALAGDLPRVDRARLRRRSAPRAAGSPLTMSSVGAGAIHVGKTFALARRRVNARTLGGETRKPFRFFLCGDPALVSAFRATLLFTATETTVELDAARTLETIVPGRAVIADSDARCILFFGRPGDEDGARIDLLESLKLPIFAVTVDPEATPQTPPSAPRAGAIGRYVVPALDREALRLHLFPHLIEACRGVEIAVGRRFPAMRETIGVKLTRDASMTALKLATASAVVDHVPILGIVLGPLASASDMVAITGVQLNLLLQIGAAYGKDPDVHRVWEMLPIVGGGFGWRALSRELAGFLPVAGIAVKGTIAYAGTIVIGEGIVFFYEHGRHMTRGEASVRFEETKRSAAALLRDVRRKIIGR